MSPPQTLNYVSATELVSHDHLLLELTKFLLPQPLQEAFPQTLVTIPTRSWHQAGKVSCIKCPGGLYCCSQVLARRHTVG